MFSMITVAARRASPMVARAGRQQARWAHSSHFDAFAVDPSSKKQMFFYRAATLGALSTPVVAVMYQVKQAKHDKRKF
ncbi:hypothetical protein PNOK_0877500 [Pyrrhoderma noxium]|uniref:Uncharacterized protein n=1 Tax=Pyrrhoderma noxium TaxID=2282107 RepID=A0A286U8J7_9AGAM|nr:hypothetical protein PNOK_0877500 [Pyrrhoderma noxium]